MAASDDIDDVLECICTQGCGAVRHKIKRLAQGRELPELRGLDAVERHRVRRELEEIMQIYGGGCDTAPQAGAKVTVPPAASATYRYNRKR